MLPLGTTFKVASCHAISLVDMPGLAFMPTSMNDYEQARPPRAGVRALLGEALRSCALSRVKCLEKTLIS